LDAGGARLDGRAGRGGPGGLSAALFLAFLAIWVVTPAPDSMRRWQPLGLARERLADDGVRGAPGLHANARADSAGPSVH